MKSGYTVTVEGQYFYPSGEGRGKLLRNYKIKLKLPSMDGAMGVIKGKLLDNVLKKKYPEYITYRTHEIVDVQPFGSAAPAKAQLWHMNREMVESYITENNLPVLPNIYPKLMELREAVASAELNVDAFIIEQKKKEVDFELMEELRELNPELYEDDETANISNKFAVKVPPEEVANVLEGL